jgi:ATP-dependent DNA helicase RecG
MGTRQTGAMQFKIADLQRDGELIAEIAKVSEQLFSETPDAIPMLCDRWLGTETIYAEV